MCPTPLRGRRTRELDFEAVFRIDPDGQVVRLETTARKPNGLAISPDGKPCTSPTTAPPVASCWPLLPLDEDGGVGSPRVLLDFGDGRGVDGLTVTTDGRLVVTAGNGPGQARMS